MDDLLYISALIKKSWSGKLTETEKDVLDAWIDKSEANKHLFETEREKLQRDVSSLEKYDTKGAIDRIFARVEKRTEYSPDIKVLKSQKKVWWAAAATVIIVLSAIAFFQPGKVNKLADQHLPEIINDSMQIVPGGNNAILTLSDGSHLVLDAAADGFISDQGNTKIVKLESGKIAYTAQANKERNHAINKISTPSGGQYQVILSDGTAVWLNAGSSISFPTEFENDSRQVEVSGEVYFEVATAVNNNRKTPFVVKIVSSSKGSVGEVQVLGTHFNINAYDDEAEVKTTLLEGAVRCIKGEDNKLLKPGQQGRISNKGISIKTNIDTETIVAWKNGTFFFDAENIQSIMRQISRWYNVEVEYKGRISNELFSGIVSRSGKLEQVLKILEAGGVKFTIEGRKIIVIQ